MAHRYELLRLMFETNKTKKAQEYSPANLVVKTRANTGSKCKTAQDDFDYNRSMTAVKIDAMMLEENVKKVTGKKLERAAAKVAEQKRKTNENTLSA